MTELKTSHKLGAGLALLMLAVLCYFTVTHLMKPSDPGQRQQHDGASATVHEQAEKSEPGATTRLDVAAVAEQQVELGRRVTTLEPTTSGDSAPAQPPPEPEQPPPVVAQPAQQVDQQQQQQQQHQAQVQSEGASQTPAAPIIAASEAPLPVKESAESTSTPPPPPNPIMSADPESEAPAGFSDRTPSEWEAWLQFKSTYAKQYKSREEALARQAVFLANLRFINNFNSMNGQTNSYQLGVNQFADMTRDEINNLIMGANMSWSQITDEQLLPPQISFLPAEAAAPLSVDWRNVTADQLANQGNCRDSAVWAAVASIESAYNMARQAKNPSLSLADRVKFDERQVLDCLATVAGEKSVCQAGQLTLVRVFEMLQRTKLALRTPSEYEELMRSGAPEPACALPLPDADSKGAVVNSYSPIRRQNMLEALQTSGPLSVALDASLPTFHFYKSGLYQDNDCSADSFNQHALLVGFGQQETSGLSQQAFVALRLSLGAHWGELGHIRMLWDESNKCLPQNLAIFPNLLQ